MEEIILFGTRNQMEQFIGSSEFAQWKVIAGCFESLFDIPDEFPIKSISLSELPKYSAKVVVVDDILSEETRRFFVENQIAFFSLDELRAIGEANKIEDENPEMIVSEPKEKTYDDGVEEKSECAQESQKPSFSEEEYTKLTGVLSDFFKTVTALLKDTKSKDDSIYNINKELQNFKGDYFYKTISPLVTDVISLRESCKQSLNDLSQYQFDSVKLLDYFSCTLEEFDNLLVVHSVEARDGMYYYGDRILYPNVSAETESEPERNHTLPQTVILPLPDGEFDGTLEGLEMKLNDFQSRIEQILQNEAVLLDTISEMFRQEKYDLSVINGKFLRPNLVKVILLKEYSEKRYAELKLLGDLDEQTQVYRDTHALLIKQLEEILLGCGIHIHVFADNFYDPKRQKILKFNRISPEETSRDKTVEKFCSDCYLYDEKVICPAKVIVNKI